MKKFWKLTNSVDSSGSTLYLEGPIASESWWGDEVTPQAFRDELKKMNSNKLTVVINSTGGDVWAGVSIHDALKELDAEVTVKVSGLAASIASVIAMAGDKIIMTPGSTMMIHRASMLAMGNADDLGKAIDMLETVEEGIVNIYAERSGQTVEAVKDMLDAETWMSADKAVELGFADEVVEAKKSEKQDTLENLFGGNFAFSMSATKDSLTSFTEKLAKSEKEGEDVVAPSEDKESPTPAPADGGEAEIEEETIEPKEEPEQTEIVEPVEPEIKDSTKKEPKMSKTEELAQDTIIEPKNQAEPKATPSPSVKDYLKTKDSMEAFARILEENAATDLKDKSAAERVRMAWKEHLETKMGVTNPEIFLPQTLITEIEDAFKEGGEIWKRVSKTGMDSFNAAWDANDDPDAESGRASGYNREENEEKREQELTFANRILRPQFVYKYITLNREDVKEQRTTGALVRFVLSELPKRIIREIERAIVIGDGRAPGSDYKIQEGNPRGFYPVKVDAAANGVFASVYTPVAGQTVYETLRRARATIKADGGVILVAKEGLLLDMEFEQNANGGFLFAPGSDMSRYIKVDAVVEPDWMDNDENDAYMFAYSYYRVVGDQSVEAFQNFILKTNKNEYLQEIWAGGGLTARKSAVAIAETPVVS